VTHLVQRETAVADQADEQLWKDAYTLARKKMARKDYAGAQESLRLIYDDPKVTIGDQAGVVLNLGLARHHLGDFKAAMAFYEEALLSPDWGDQPRKEIIGALRAARLGKPPLAEGEAGPAADKVDKVDNQYWEDTFKLARIRLNKSDYVGAEKLFRQLYDDPKLPIDDWGGLVLNLGLVRHHVGDFKGAASFYREALQSPAWRDDDRKLVIANLHAARLGKPPGGYEAEAKKPKADQVDEQLWKDAFTLARKKIAKGDHLGAEKLLRLIYDDPKVSIAVQAGVVANLGLVRHALGDFRGALSFYIESLQSPEWGAGPRKVLLANVRQARLHKPPQT
jgi:tetratricopeptide (TPR) repeat protein